MIIKRLMMQVHVSVSLFKPRGSVPIILFI